MLLCYSSPRGLRQVSNNSNHSKIWPSLVIIAFTTKYLLFNLISSPQNTKILDSRNYFPVILSSSLNVEDGQWKTHWINENLTCICVLKLIEWEPQSYCQLPPVINLCVFFQSLCPISAATVGPHHNSPTRFSVKVMMCIISSFLSFKRK